MHGTGDNVYVTRDLHFEVVSYPNDRRLSNSRHLAVTVNSSSFISPNSFQLQSFYTFKRLNSLLYAVSITHPHNNYKNGQKKSYITKEKQNKKKQPQKL